MDPSIVRSPASDDIKPPPVLSSISVATTDNVTIQEPLRLLLTALGIGIAFDFLFQGGQAALGLNVLVTVVLFLITLGVSAMRESKPARRQILFFFGIPLLFFATMVSVHASATLTGFNVFACFIITSLLLYFWSVGEPYYVSFGGWFLLPWKTFGGTLATLPVLFRDSSKKSVISTDRQGHYASIARGVLLTIPIFLIFAALFSQADAVFAKHVNDLAAIFQIENWDVLITRLVWILAVAAVAAGAIGYALVRREKINAIHVPRQLPFGVTESSIVLGALMALFAAFIWIQLSYLFGGDARVQSVPNLTYAEYARHGFAELTMVALLALGLISTLKVLTLRETVIQQQTFALLATGLLLLTLPLLVSAFARMRAYEAAYGATELRLYVDVFMVWLAISLCWCATTLWTRISGGPGIYVCAVGFLMTLNAINPEQNIARRNIEHFARTGRMDDAYMGSLSEDAFPELLRWQAMQKETTSKANATSTNQFAMEVIDASIKTIEQRSRQSNYSGIGAWNLSRMRAKREIKVK